eukprot:NODE_123_length_18841_cov_0.279693.p1 type:complete len:837 gc:universal NODE_123_length_18841_cov_0.279693:13673-11163(-)
MFKKKVQVYPENLAEIRRADSGDQLKYIKWEGNLYMETNGKLVSQLVQVYRQQLVCLSSRGTRTILIEDILKVTRSIEDAEISDSKKFKCEVKTANEHVLFSSPKEHVLIDFVSILTKLLILKDKKGESRSVLSDGQLPKLNNISSTTNEYPQTKRKVIIEEFAEPLMLTRLKNESKTAQNTRNFRNEVQPYEMESGTARLPLIREHKSKEQARYTEKAPLVMGSLYGLQSEVNTNPFLKTGPQGVRITKDLPMSSMQNLQETFASEEYLKTGPRKRRVESENKSTSLKREPRQYKHEVDKLRLNGSQRLNKKTASESRLHDLISTNLIGHKNNITDSEEDFYEPATLKEELYFLTAIDFKFVVSIFNIKPFFIPLTRRKIFLYVLYAFVGTFLSGFTVIPSGYDILSQFCSINASLLLVQFLMIDPSVVLACVLLCRYPPLPKKQRNNKENPSIALIITCHKSSEAISETLRAALVHLEPQNIFIADNGNEKKPMDDTLEVIKKMHPKINYRWNNIGSKTLAQYLAVRQIVKERNDIKHIMIIDDDVTISPHLRFPVERIEGNTKALVIGIRGVDNKGKQKVLWTKWQDMEYKVSDFVKIFQDQYSSVMYPHGAISLWDKEILLKILIDHDAIFYADDVKMGMWLTRRGYRLGYYADAVVNTATPASILGPSPNYYNQRVRSWDFAEHMLTWRYIKCLCFGYVKNSPFQTLVLKFFQLYSLYTNLIDWLKIPGIVFYMTHEPGVFGITFSSMLILNTGSILAWNYISCRNRPDIRISLTTILTFPIYKLISSIIRIISVFRCALVYWPRFKPKDFRPKLLTGEKIKDIEQWMENH